MWAFLWFHPHARLHFIFWMKYRREKWFFCVSRSSKLAGCMYVWFYSEHGRWAGLSRLPFDSCKHLIVASCTHEMVRYKHQGVLVIVLAECWLSYALISQNVTSVSVQVSEGAVPVALKCQSEVVERNNIVKSDYMQHEFRVCVPDISKVIKKKFEENMVFGCQPTA